jgi:hypothetical protein
VIGDRAEVVLNQEDGDSVIVERFEQIIERFDRLDIDPDGWFVKDEEVGLARQRAGDEGPLSLPTGKLCHPSIREGGHPNGIECTVNDIPVGLREPTEANVRESTHFDYFADGDRHLLGGTGVLGDVADSGAVIEPMGWFAKQLGCPLIRREKSQYELHQRRLPRTVRTDDSHVLAIVYLERNISHNRRRRVAEVDVVDVDERSVTGRFRLTRRVRIVLRAHSKFLH